MRATDAVCCEGMPEYVLHQVWLRDADGTDFCTNCGARMGTASPAVAPAEPAPMPAAGMPPVQKKSHKRAVIVGMCVVGVLVAAVPLWR